MPFVHGAIPVAGEADRMCFIAERRKIIHPGLPTPCSVPCAMLEKQRGLVYTFCRLPYDMFNGLHISLLTLFLGFLMLASSLLGVTAPSNIQTIYSRYHHSLPNFISDSWGSGKPLLIQRRPFLGLVGAIFPVFLAAPFFDLDRIYRCAL